MQLNWNLLCIHTFTGDLVILVRACSLSLALLWLTLLQWLLHLCLSLFLFDCLFSSSLSCFHATFKTTLKSLCQFEFSKTATAKHC